MLLIRSRLKVRIYYIAYLSLHNGRVTRGQCSFRPVTSQCAGGMTHRFPPCSGHARWPVQYSLVPGAGGGGSAYERGGDARRLA